LNIHTLVISAERNEKGKTTEAKQVIVRDFRKNGYPSV
jgi:hypothetical protein